MAKYEHELHAFDELGLSDHDRDAALAYLLTFVRAHARAAEDARQAQEESAIDDQQWWEINEPLLRRVFDPTAYPLAVRVGTAAGSAHGSAWEPEHAWAFGLDRTLDGLAALIDRRADESRRVSESIQYDTRSRCPPVRRSGPAHCSCLTTYGVLGYD